MARVGVVTFSTMSRLRAVSPHPLKAVRQMSSVASHMSEVYLVERFHSRIEVHPSQNGRIERMAVRGKHLSRELIAKLAPYSGKINRWVVNASVAPVNDARKVTGRGITENVLGVEVAVDQRGSEGKAGVVVQKARPEGDNCRLLPSSEERKHVRANLGEEAAIRLTPACGIAAQRAVSPRLLDRNSMHRAHDLTKPSRLRGAILRPAPAGHHLLPGNPPAADAPLA